MCLFIVVQLAFDLIFVDLTIFYCFCVWILVLPCCWVASTVWSLTLWVCVSLGHCRVFMEVSCFKFPSNRGSDDGPVTNTTTNVCSSVVLSMRGSNELVVLVMCQRGLSLDQNNIRIVCQGTQKLYKQQFGQKNDLIQRGEITFCTLSSSITLQPLENCRFM